MASAKLLLALFLGHAVAALYHHFVKRDATLKRMWFGQ
ncbi:cytochrome b/b6 domain-containing protein [Hoeflea sp.]|nr:cytochrome b/b6 domain-containing protein [Hoeflea sp.]